MIIYENDKYVVQQSEINKHILIIEKVNKTEGKIIMHASYDENAPFLTEEQGKAYVAMFTDSKTDREG